MPKKTTKKRIVLWVLLTVFLLLFAVIAIPIATLYVQYQNISYTPSVPVERPDTYVMPEYPEVIPGSEGITDIPEGPEIPDEIPSETDTGDGIPEESGTEPIEPDPDTEETTGPPPVEPSESTAPETLPPVIYTPPETDAPAEDTPASSGQSNSRPSTTPHYNHNNSFANTPKTISVYGRTPIYKVDRIDDNIINILVLGTDSRDVALDRGRSDTMLVVSYNQKTGEIKMVSLLRDMLVPIEGYDWNRLNTAYFFDGVGLSINTINQLFGLDIQHFVVVDLNGAKNFIDYLGGVELTLSESEAKYVGLPYSAEPMLLNGSQALNHMRNRTSDNDFGRTERQREVIVALFEMILTEKSLSEILDITQYAMGMVKTNISVPTLTSLATSIVGSAGKLSIHSQSLPYKDAYQFVWYKKMAVLSFDIQNTADRMHAFLYD